MSQIKVMYDDFEHGYPYVAITPFKLEDIKTFKQNMLENIDDLIINDILNSSGQITGHRIEINAFLTTENRIAMYIKKAIVSKCS